MKYVVKMFYADVTAGTVGELMNKFTDQHGNHWVRLYLCKNLGGQKITRCFPVDLVEPLTYNNREKKSCFTKSNE